MFNLVNPIPDSIKDTKTLTEFFEKYSIIPYYGYGEETSHNFLKLLSDICTLSASHKACKDDIKMYAFGSRVDIIKQPIPGLIEESDDVVSNIEKRSFYENFFKRYNISVTECVNVTREIYEQISDSGNGYLKISISTVGGTTQVDLKVLHYKHVAYLLTQKNEDKILVYTKKWGDETYWDKVKPELYTASYVGKQFNWKKTGSKIETVLHLKTKNDDSDYYGRPDILSVLYWMFTEWAQSDLALKTGSTEFVAKTLLAFEEPDPARKIKGSSDENRGKQFRQKLNVLRELATNEGEVGNAKTLAAIEYPFGGQPPQAINLNINRDTAFTEQQIKNATDYIYAAHRWNKELTGFSAAKSNIGGNVILDLFTVKNTAVIVPMQDDYTQVWANILQEIATQVGYTSEVYTFQFPNLIEELVLNLANAKNSSSVIANGVQSEDIETETNV